MTFHADFWVVVGTAAPIIALSTILVSGDQLQLDIEVEISTGKAPGDIPFRQWSDLQHSSFFWGMVTAIIIPAQAGTFAISLLSLTRESNVLREEAARSADARAPGRFEVDCLAPEGAVQRGAARRCLVRAIRMRCRCGSSPPGRVSSI
jgi:hypothetical protein